MKSPRSTPLLAFAILLALPVLAIAQGASPTPPQAKEVTIIEMIKVGGWTMWFLGICSVATIALTVYNGIMVRTARMLNPAVVSELTDLLTNLDVDGARALCEAKPCLVTNIVKAGLSRIDNGEVRLDSIEKGMEEASVEEIGANLVPINYISAAAVTAPMFGLLGTVSGMISAFRAMAIGGMGRPELLADNISEALITTATGLIIGIPAMVSYLYFKNKFTSIIASLNRTLGNIFEKFKIAVKRVERASQEG
ncbi:MAG: MotA/TolQ/ExbB proton channel family protein [Terrimicrobiaceae bacterium]